MNDVKSEPTDPIKVYSTFTNSAGQTYRIHGLSPMLPEQIENGLREEWKEKGRALPSVPSYEVVTSSGEKELHAHDEKSIMTASAIDQALWKGYQEASAEFEGEKSSRLMRKVFLCVDVHPTDEWRADLEYVGVKLPPKGSPAERYKFVELEVIQSAEDIAMLPVAVLRLAGIINQAGEEAAKASFRSLLGQAYSQAGVPEIAKRIMESKPILQRSSDSPLLAEDAIRAELV